MLSLSDSHGWVICFVLCDSVPNIEPCLGGSGKAHTSHPSQKVKCGQRQRSLLRTCHCQVLRVFNTLCRSRLALKHTHKLCFWKNWRVSRISGLPGKEPTSSTLPTYPNSNAVYDFKMVYTITQQESARKGFWLR